MVGCDLTHLLRALPGLVACLATIGLAASGQAQNADELRRIWNDPSLLDRPQQQQQPPQAQQQPAQQQPDDRARVAAEHAARQRAALEAEQKAVLGLSEEERRRIQTALGTLGFYRGPADGNLASPETVKAVGDWQKAKGRPLTGKLTPPEVKLLHEEAVKAATKERLDAGAGIAARKSEAARIVPAELADRLFDGAREDVLVLLNETAAAPSLIRSAGKPPGFKEQQATACAPFAWALPNDFVAYIRGELAKLGAERVRPDPVRVCAEPRPPVDLVLLERRHLFEQAPEKLKPLLDELRERKLALLAMIPYAAFIEQRDKQDAERRRLDAARRADEEKKVQSAAVRATVDELMKLRQASEPRAEAMAAGLIERLKAYVGGGSLDEGFADFRRWYEARQREGRTIDTMRTAIDDFGNGRFQGRSLDAIAVVVYFDLKSVGDTPPQTDCLVFAWLEEAPIRRVPGVFACDRVAALEQWKADNGFHSQWR